MIDRPLINFLNTDGVFILTLLALWYLWFVKREKMEAVRVIFSVFLAGLVAIVLKEMFGLPRPFMVSNVTPEAGLAIFSSFPSFHSAVAFSLAATVTFQKKRLGAALMFIAFLIGLGRILANVHYPEDVFFGVVIGIVIAALTQNLFKNPRLDR
jgi:undecaprenyl-diphosphatase